jgi:large subunit ribosomal protein L25
MSEIILEAMPRENLKKEASKRYRREGFIPSVIYGQGKNTNILVKRNAFDKLHSKLTRSTIISLKLENKEYDVLIKDYDKNYVRDEFIHLDFYQLDSKKSVHVSIPLEFIGTPAGVRDGGLLEKHLVKIEIACLPKDILPSIQINVENLKINDSLHVKDIPLDKKYKVISHLDEVVIRISSSEKEEAVEVKAEATEAAATAATATPAADATKTAPAADTKTEKK